MSRKARRAATGAPDIERVRRRIEQWRRTRAKKTRMPDELWAAAVGLARDHGIYAVARGLRVSYDSLKSRLKGRPPQSRAPKSAPAAAFVDLGPALPFATGPAGATLELTDSSGAKLAVRLAAGDTIDLPGLARDFWRRRA
jgi:hypothetical protein